MVGFNMDGPSRDAVLKLMDEKDKIEGELREQNAILHNNNVGMDEPLVDAEGYPRNDVDVYKVRHARHRIICLKNDLKEIMKRIEQGLWEVYDPSASHSRTTSREQPQAVEHANGFSSHTTDDVQNGDLRSFAVIGVVQPGSPADVAGLMENDELLQFGSINHSNFSDITQIQAVVAHSVGRPLQVRARRGRRVLCAALVPRPWAQPGLLGCQVRRLP